MVHLLCDKKAPKDKSDKNVLFSFLDDRFSFL